MVFSALGVIFAVAGLITLGTLWLGLAHTGTHHAPRGSIAAPLAVGLLLVAAGAALTYLGT